MEMMLLTPEKYNRFEFNLTDRISFLPLKEDKIECDQPYEQNNQISHYFRNQVKGEFTGPIKGLWFNK